MTACTTSFARILHSQEQNSYMFSILRLFAVVNRSRACDGHRVA